MLYYIPNFIDMIEVLLTGIVIALFGAGIYVFFISSMHADRNARWREKYYKNPWETIDPNSEPAPQKKFRLTKYNWMWLIAMAVSIIMLVAFELIFKNGWYMVSY